MSRPINPKIPLSHKLLFQKKIEIKIFPPLKDILPTMTLNFAQVFGDDYQTADLPAYPLLSININCNSWETFTSDGEEFVLRRLNEIVSNMVI